MDPTHTPGITPANDGAGNDAYRAMKATLAKVTAQERGR